MADFKSKNIHEIQHAIQDREGFAAGGNPDMFESDLLSLADLNKISFSEMDDFQRSMFGQLRKKYKNAKTPYEAYKMLAGEVEARNVQIREKMTKAERKSRPPWTTIDVPESSLIYMDRAQ